MNSLGALASSCIFFPGRGQPVAFIAQVEGLVLGLQSSACHGTRLQGAALGREVLPAVFFASVGVFSQILRR